MDAAATPEGAIRIGLAHGPVRSFSEDTVAADILAPDRARRAGLDYLALGDWHGAVAIDARTHYCGTPEPDRFKHDRPGQALVVAIDAVGAEPIVTPVETGLFTWKTEPLHLLPADDCEAALAAALPQPRLRRRTLLRVVASGRARIAGRTALAAAIEAAAPDFALLELDETALATECDAEDLDRIDRSGALRDAADMLLAQAGDESRAEADREVARGALVRLFSYCATASS
jgi:DNA repair exonuclease SbcCD nuclease subunit